MPGGLANSQDLVNIEEIRDNTVILKGGRILQILMVDGVNFALKSEQEQNIITYGYQNFLNSVDFPLQILVHSRKINIESYLAKLQELEHSEKTTLLQNQISEYRQFIDLFVRDNAIMQKSFFVVIPFTSPATSVKAAAGGGITKFLPFFKKDKGAEDRAAQQKEMSFEESLSQIQQRTDQAVSGLQTIGLDATQLKNEEIAELFYNFYNPGNIEREQMNIVKETGEK